MTDQSLGIFSSAEGFVFLSGLLAGWVYTRKIRSGGFEGLRRAAFARAETIYAWHIASFIGALLAVFLTQHGLGISAPTSPILFLQHPLEALGLGIVLLHQPGLLDLLPMYCAFVLLLPVTIAALEAGRRWWVLGISSAIWLGAQLLPSVDPAALFPINTGSFNIYAWQFIFIAGVAIGHARLNGDVQVVRPNPGVILGAAAVAVYCLGIRYLQWPSLWPDSLYGIFLNKPSLGLLRLADFAAIAYFVGILGARFPRLLDIRPLEFLGRHSIAVVAAQSVAVMILLQFSGLSATVTERTLVALGTIGFLFVAAGASQSLKSRGTQPSAPSGPPARQDAAVALTHSNEGSTIRKPADVPPGSGPLEGGASADSLHPDSQAGKRCRALVAPVPVRARACRVRERTAH